MACRAPRRISALIIRVRSMAALVAPQLPPFRLISTRYREKVVNKPHANH